MALKVKAVEKKIKFSKTDEGVYRYVMQPELYIPLTTEKVIKEAQGGGPPQRSEQGSDAGMLGCSR